MNTPEQQPTFPDGVREAAQAQARGLANKLWDFDWNDSMPPDEVTAGWSAILLPTLAALHRENAELRAAGEGLKGALEEATDRFTVIANNLDSLARNPTPSVLVIRNFASVARSGADNTRRESSRWSAATRKGGGA